MQVVLFEDSQWLKVRQRDLTNLKRRKFSLSEDYKGRVDKFIHSWKNEKDKSMLIDNLEQPRTYFEVFNSYQDSHFFSEMIGINDNRHKFYHIISFEDSLDFILSHLSGKRLELLSAMMNDYHSTSRALLKLDTHSLSIELAEFFNRYEALDSYIENKVLVNKGNELENFITQICSLCSSMLIYLSYQIQKRYKVSVRSLGRCRLLLSGAEKIDDKIEIVGSKEIGNYTLNINSYSTYDLPDEFFKYGDWS